MQMMMMMMMKASEDDTYLLAGILVQALLYYTMNETIYFALYLCLSSTLGGSKSLQ